MNTLGEIEVSKKLPLNDLNKHFITDFPEPFEREKYTFIHGDKNRPLPTLEIDDPIQLRAAETFESQHEATLGDFVPISAEQHFSRVKFQHEFHQTFNVGLFT
jgi:hypothetical protein